MWNLKKVFKMKEGRKMKFEILANEWLEYKKNEIKESTYFNYMINIENHLIPYFKGVCVEDIVNYNNLVQELTLKLSSKTIRDIIVILKSIFKYYEEEYNCKLKIKKVAIPKIEKKKVEILTKKEQGRIENYCMNNLNLKTIGILVCLNTGLRIGEICSLKWENIDFEEKVIRVKKTVQRLYNKKEKQTKLVIGNPKTDDSVRTIQMNKKLLEILYPIRKQYKSGCFLLSGKEKCIEPRRYQDIFKNILKKSKVKEYKFHILRHTFATNCISVGMDIKSLSELLGHANINVTLKIYVHSSNKIKKKYLEKI